MKRSSEFTNKSTLYLVSSPIGNIKDITYRALEVLKDVEYLFSEDTRVTSKLLNFYGIKRSLDSYHDFSNKEKEDYIISLLLGGHDCALISDCGTPVISDPGYEIVKRCRELDIKVTPIPGASASVAAITMSGFPIKPYMFYGFLDHKESKKIKELEALKNYEFSICFYESPLRIKETIKDMYKVFGDRKCMILREITKMYEESIELNLSEYDSLNDSIKGEMVVIVEGFNKENEKEEIDIISSINKMISDGFSVKEASKILAEKLNTKSSDIYNFYQGSKK